MYWKKLGLYNGTITPLRKMNNLKHKVVSISKQNKAFEMVPVPLSCRFNVAGFT